MVTSARRMATDLPTNPFRWWVGTMTRTLVGGRRLERDALGTE